MADHNELSHSKKWTMGKGGRLYLMLTFDYKRAEMLSFREKITGFKQTGLWKYYIILPTCFFWRFVPVSWLTYSTLPLTLSKMYSGRSAANTVRFLEITINPQQHKMFMVATLQGFHMQSGKSTFPISYQVTVKVPSHLGRHWILWDIYF